jgi:hypothetical protein
MAQAIISDSQLRLVFDMGVNAEGKAIYKNKNFSNIKTTATTDGLFSVAQGLVGRYCDGVIKSMKYAAPAFCWCCFSFGVKLVDY